MLGLDLGLFGLFGLFQLGELGAEPNRSRMPWSSSSGHTWCATPQRQPNRSPFIPTSGWKRWPRTESGILSGCNWKLRREIKIHHILQSNLQCKPKLNKIQILVPNPAKPPPSTMFSSSEWSCFVWIFLKPISRHFALQDLRLYTAVALPFVRKAISMIRREPSLVALHPRVAISWWSYRNCQNSQDGIGDLWKTLTFCLLQTRFVDCIHGKCRGFRFFKSGNHQLLHFPNKNHGFKAPSTNSSSTAFEVQPGKPGP